MYDRPLNLSRYIMLVSKDELPKPVVGSWLRDVTAGAPSGVVATLQAVDNKGFPRAVTVVHREANNAHQYLIPLTRDLMPLEVDQIVRDFSETHPDMDFDVETHASSMTALTQPSISVDQEQHIALCTALAKQKHEDWLRERADAGWRYGPTFSAENKTHPLLRPWEQLPDRYREVDMDWPQKLVDVLGQQGYAVVARSDIDRMMNLLRGTV